MAHRIENKDIVIDGWENGISDDPYTGISDLRAVNTISVPGEASVNFATTKKSPPLITGTATSANAGSDTITCTGITGLESNMTITFSATTIGGVSINTTYWVSVSGSTIQLYSAGPLTTLVNITSDGTGTFTTIIPTTPKHWTYNMRTGNYFMLDDSGKCWSDFVSSATSEYFGYMGNLIGGTGSTDGNGLITFSDSKNNDYLFVFRRSRIDYLKLNLGTLAWVYGWDPSTGGNGANYGFNNVSTGVNHTAIYAQDNTVYYCDGFYVGSFFQKAVGTAFDPTNTTTYTYNTTALRLPSYEKSICLAELGTTLLVGGIRNAIYPWDRISTSFSYPILIAESYISRMETINTTTYIFAGNRGRIYTTNGYQASLYKKVPDHLSDTVEPYFIWGGTCSVKNQLYFGVKATTNAGVAIDNYGGLWAIDVDTKALRCTAKLSYATYAGYASSLIQKYSTGPTDTPSGSGVYIGWNDGTNGGIDQGSSNPFTGGEAYVESEMIPVGTYLTKKTFEQVEYKLSKPLVAGESVALYYKTSVGGSLTSIPLTQGNSTGDLSGLGTVNFQNVQWVALRAVLTSTNTNPSYTRLKELRIR